MEYRPHSATEQVQIAKYLQKHYHTLTLLAPHVRDACVAALQHGLTMEDIVRHGIDNVTNLLALKIADNTSENAA